MEFNPHKPIYLQIADALCNRVLSGEWLPNARIPSVRELGTSLGVNPNTIMRVYEYLQSLEVIYNKRGIGYFICSDAYEQIIRAERKHFMREELPAFVARMKLLGIDIKSIENELNKKQE
ncbi:MAG: GntR family transcriptional regulator [Bacteroidales bacterium]